MRKPINQKHVFTISRIFISAFFGNLNIVISALEIWKSGGYRGMMDHLTIINDLDVAKQYKCLGSV